MYSKQEIEQARDILLRGNDIESASLILRAMIIEGWKEIGGRVDILKVATVEILDFVEEHKNKGYLDVVREKVKANEKVKQLEAYRQKLIEKLEEDVENASNNIKHMNKNNILQTIARELAIGMKDYAKEILELVKGEKSNE